MNCPDKIRVSGLPLMLHGWNTVFEKTDKTYNGYPVYRCAEYKLYYSICIVSAVILREKGHWVLCRDDDVYIQWRPAMKPTHVINDHLLSWTPKTHSMFGGFLQSQIRQVIMLTLCKSRKDSKSSLSCLPRDILWIVCTLIASALEDSPVGTWNDGVRVIEAKDKKWRFW